jgi:hypothetical protein
MAKVRIMGSSTVITRDGKDGSLNIQRSHLWTPVDRGSGAAAPVDHGLVGWTFDPTTAFGTSQPANGVVSLARVNLGPRMAYQISTVWVSLSSGGQGLSNCFLGVYSISGDSATLAGASSDLSNQFGAAGEVSASLGSPASINGGRAAWVLIGLLVGGSSTKPVFRGALAQTLVNANLAGTAKRYATVGSGLTKLPQSFTTTDMGPLGCLPWAAAG